MEHIPQIQHDGHDRKKADVQRILIGYDYTALTKVN